MLSHKKEDVKYAQCLFIGKRQQQQQQQQQPITTPTVKPPPKYKEYQTLGITFDISHIFCVCDF